jgi:hypothetical protein
MRSPTIAQGSIVGLVLVVVVGSLFVLLRTETIPVQVVSHEWKRSIFIEIYQTNHYIGRYSTPYGAYNIYKYDTSHTYVDANGIVQTDWDTEYDYDLNEWTLVDKVISTGVNKNLYWPTTHLRQKNPHAPSLGDLRERQREDIRILNLVNTQDEKTLYVFETTPTHWESFADGDLGMAKKNIMGIELIEPLERSE